MTLHITIQSIICQCLKENFVIARSAFATKQSIVKGCFALGLPMARNDNTRSGYRTMIKLALDFHKSSIFLQNFRDFDRAVFLLIILDNGEERPIGKSSAI